MPSNQNRDNFIDKAFTVIAESIVKIMPIAEKEKKAYIYYRDGLAAQNNGDYSEALEYYKESLLLEENKIDRGETLKNMAIIYMSNGEEDLSIETYEKALLENPKQPSCLKNIPPLASSSFIGELGLSGQVRKSNNLRIKIEEAVRLGIKNIVVPKLEEELNNNFQNLINIKEISNIKEAVDYSLSDEKLEIHID